jgi:hypothetical protein
MFGAGWHSSMEAQKTIVAYAPLQTDFALKEYDVIYSSLTRYLPSAQIPSLCSPYVIGCPALPRWIMFHIPWWS